MAQTPSYPTAPVHSHVRPHEERYMPADPYKQTEVQRYLLQPVASWLERIVGAVAAMFGMALLSALCFVVYALLTRSDAKSTVTVYITIFILAVLTAFLLNAGIRLLFSHQMYTAVSFHQRSGSRFPLLCCFSRVS